MIMANAIYNKQYKNIVEKLKKARFQSGYTQVEMAKKLKRPQSHISKLESGDQKIDILELKEWAKICNKSVEYFLK